jgi:hypothetical protein
MQGPLQIFRQILSTDETLQASLGEIEEPDVFVARACDAARSRGLALSTQEILAELRPDPLGLSAPPTSASGERWPSAGWLPIHVGPSPDGRGVVDWAYFGTMPLDAPFFEMSARSARLRPFNRLCRWRMDIDRFVEAANLEDLTPPRGLIFHMSRCGSTLVAQMLAAATRNVVVSEAPPLDAMARLHELRGDVTQAQRRRALVAMAAALGRRRSGAETSSFLKLDSWHSVALPLFREAFPTTPWVFLYREPIEVLVSQMRARGMQTVPGLLPRDLQGADESAELGAEQFCARVLEKSCAAAVEHFGLGDGLLVNYEELPEAVFTKILPHFGLRPEAAEISAMRAAALRDAKAPHSGFASDREEKRRAATQRVREAAEQSLAGVYATLEKMRARGA